jgi:ABC-type branched-subunit amino acid transport system substrate-binding protein
MIILKRIKIFAAIVIIPFIFFGCFQKKEVAIPGRSPSEEIEAGEIEAQEPVIKDIEQVEEEDIKQSDIIKKERRIIIGCMLPLSGKYQKIGKRALNGLEFAVYNFNNRHAGLFSAKLLIQDTAGATEQALAGLKELAQKVSAVIGPMIAVGPEVQNKAIDYNIPLIMLSNKSKIEQSEDFIFRNFLTPKNQVEAIVSYAVLQLGIKKFAVLYPDENYGRDFMKLLNEELEKHNGYVSAAAAYDINAVDFSDYVKRLISQSVNFEAIFIPDVPEKAGLIIPHLAYNDIRNLYIFGTNLWHSPKLVRTVSNNTKGVIIPDGFFAEAVKNEVREFSESFEAVYTNKPQFIEAVAYDTANFLLETTTMVEAGLFLSISDGLKNIQGYDGVAGLRYFDGFGEAVKNIYLLRLGASGFQEIK